MAKRLYPVIIPSLSQFLRWLQNEKHVRSGRGSPSINSTVLVGT
jgi:hypothetical protein